MADGLIAPEHEACPVRSPRKVHRRQRSGARRWSRALLGNEKAFSIRSESTFRPWQWTLAFLAILVGDYLTGPFLPSAILFYFIPIGMAAWSRAPRSAIAMALLWPPLRLGIMMLWGTSGPWRLTIEDSIVNGIVSVAFASLVWHVVEQERKLRLLQGMLPICGFCKRIRDEGEWRSVESYITEHSEAVFSHTFCAECAKQHYGV
jgi:hypothetical protein